MDFEITQEMLDEDVRKLQTDEIKLFLEDALENLSHINVPNVSQCREKIMEAIFWLEA